MNTACGTKEQTNMIHFRTKILFLKENILETVVFSSQDLDSVCAVKKASNLHIVQCG